MSRSQVRLAQDNLITCAIISFSWRRSMQFTTVPKLWTYHGISIQYMIWKGMLSDLLGKSSLKKCGEHVLIYMYSVSSCVDIPSLQPLALQNDGRQLSDSPWLGPRTSAALKMNPPLKHQTWSIKKPLNQAKTSKLIYFRNLSDILGLNSPMYSLGGGQ